ncbi:MAG TPA: hypothetical protein VLH59_01430 [Ignavibacteriaceae bacterium]|nr:hypothetical protein [Ignavibacteriaceae bacterium]
MKTTFYFLVCFIVIYISTRSLAQEKEEPFSVSPLIGDTLSLEERDYYNLLPTINNFQWAIFYLNPDSTLDAKVTYLKNSTPQDTIINNYRTLRSLVLHLNAAENPETMNPIQNKDYAGNEVRVLYDNGIEATGNLLSATSSSLIIYSSNCDEKVININCATLIKTNDLEKLSVKSDFNLGKLLYPLVAGLAAVIIYNSTLTPEENNLDNMGKNMLTGFAVGVGGMVLGFALSYAVPLKISSEEEYSTPFNEDDIEGLSKISRYKDFEPYYIQRKK